MENVCEICNSNNLIDNGSFRLCTDCNHFNEIIEVKEVEKAYSSEYCLEKCNLCKHSDWVNDDKNGSVVCFNCGNIQSETYISNKQDWSSYADDRTQGIDNCRVSTFDKNNPKTTLGSAISTADKNLCMFTVEIPNKEQEEGEQSKSVIRRNINTLNYIVSCKNSNNKEEQAYHRVIKQLNNFGIMQRVIGVTIHIWSFVYNTGTTYRGRSRLGILGNCIYQACLLLNYSRTKRVIKDKLSLTNKEFSKGTRILAVHYPDMINVEDETMIIPEAIFSHIISEFRDYYIENHNWDGDCKKGCMGMCICKRKNGFTYRNYVPRCVEIYNLCKNRSLEANRVSMDTAKAGVVYYVFKERFKKTGCTIPKVSEIKKVMKVTNPTGAYNRIVQQFKEDSAILIIQRFIRQSNLPSA